MPESKTTPQEIGLELVKLLTLGKQPCKHSDALWEAALKLLNMKWEIEITNQPVQIPSTPMNPLPNWPHNPVHPDSNPTITD